MGCASGSQAGASNAQSCAIPDGQDHIDWTAPAVRAVVDMMSTSYPGGISGYVQKARQLLHPSAVSDSESTAKRNLKLPAHRVDVPFVETGSDPNLLEGLELGNRLAGTATAFVLVAGGLGERLGASSLKLSLPVQIAARFARKQINNNNGSESAVYRDEGCFLHHYISWMMHCSSSNSNNNNDSAPPPLILMTSDDTHSRTLELLESNSYFGMPAGNVHLLRQTGVPCVSDSNGKLAGVPSEDGKGKSTALVMKPHGHGDIHRLLLSSGLLTGRLKQRGIKYLVFMQDTNSGATTTLPQSLAVMEQRKWSMGFTCVPRMPGEAIGALVEADRLMTSSSNSAGAASANSSNNEQLGARVTYCVEYNVLDEMLKREGFEQGDAPASPSQPFSAFPGTINTLLLRLDVYTETVARTEGVIAEFINPKYADPAKKTDFKSPARLETLMQDIAVELPASSGPIGAVVFDRRTYFPVKNAIKDGVTKWQTMGIDPHNASQGEAGCFQLRRLAAAPFVNQDMVATWPQVRCVAPSAVASNNESNNGAPSFASDIVVLGQLPVAVFPIIQTPVPLDAMSAAKMFGGRGAVKISRRSSLVIVSSSSSSSSLWNVVIESLDLDGALVIELPPALAGDPSMQQSSPLMSVVVDFGSTPIKNKGWKLVPVDPTAAAGGTEAEKLRGFRYESDETLVIRIPAGLAAADNVVKVMLCVSQDNTLGPTFSVLSKL